MAATLQQQPQHANPQLKRLVYSKYRELLGSYNDKANTIIQALPAYMVTEDKGFNFDVQADAHDKDEADFSVPPPPPPTLPANGSLPTRRLPASEPPACVQNAMMTKDKKPFTYTPGGIDLSQIKSPRMAKRIARNAQYEGITNQPKPSPLAQNQQNNAYSAGSAPAAPPPPASTMGVPVQVFPTGPPPPPAPPSSSNVPPPPPPMASQLVPQSNGRDTRKSPTPQNFEPPPLGCRPEIKIPPNPIASLKKVPKPEPKNDFWVEEYRKERSKSPMPGETQCQEESANQHIRQDAPPRELSPKPTKPPNSEEDNSDPRRDPNRIAFQQQRPAQQYQPQVQTQPQQHPQPFYQQQRPMQPLAQAQKQDEPSYPPHMDPNRIAFQQQRQQQQPQQPMSPIRTPAGTYQPAAMSPNVQRVDSPFRMQDNANLQRPLSPVKVQNSPPAYQQQPQQSPYYMRQSQQQPQPQPPYQPRQNVTSPSTQQQKPTQVGSLYIAPVSPENLVAGNEQPRSAGLQQTPPWLSQRPSLKENPEWVREVNSSPAANRTQTPPIVGNQQSSGGPGLRLQMTPNQTSANPKERIIPIQLEKTPTPTRTPSTPGFGPQPYTPQPYTPSSQYGSVASPGSGYPSPNTAVVRNPNQFVDQGYNNWPNQPQQGVMSPQVQQQGGARIIPITIERDDAPFSPTSARGPISPAPMVIQNDPRTPQSPRSNGIPPNQSKSFRVLQKITDTEIAPDSDGEQPAELHGPQYSRQMGDTTDQMRRMQINDSNQQAAFVNRGPIQRQTQRYVQQRPVYQEDDQPQQYVHPSEQQVHEPKIYTGSAIPSRSFKILQAMTTPENAVETEDSSVVENEPIYCNPLHRFPYPASCTSSTTPMPFFLSESKEAPFQPYCYYYPQYDKEERGDFGNYSSDSVKPIEGAPNIIITAHDEDTKNCSGQSNEQEIKKQDDKDDEEEEKDDGYASMKPQNAQHFEGSARFTMEDLARKLNEISSSEDLTRARRNSPFCFDDDDSRLSKSPSPTHDKSRSSEEDSDNLFTSSSSSSEGCDKGKIHSSSEGLHAIKSVTNIKVYDNCEELEEEQRKVNEIDQENTKGEESQTKTDSHKKVENVRLWIREWDDDEDDKLDQEMQPVCSVESGSDTDEGDDLTEDVEGVEIKDNLSVIYEESESTEQRKRTQSMNSESSTLSECSTTIANDDPDENYSDNDAGTDKEQFNENEDNDDEENSVTVRLPLRLSFSRSSNDENITTVVVGDSEIHDSRRSSLKTIEDRDDDFDFKTDNDGQENDDSNNDVSVVFSLKSRSNSIDRIGLLSKTSSVDHETSVKDWDDSDSESVSVSISLPMKRNKFMTQTLNSSLTNNVHEMRSDWDESERDAEKRKDQSSQSKFEREELEENEDSEEEEGHMEEEEEQEDAEDEASEEESDDESNPRNDLRKANDVKPMKIVSAPLDDAECTEPVSQMVDALRQLRAFSEEVVKRATIERELEQKSIKTSFNKRLSVEEIETEASKVFQNVERRKSVERTIKTPVDFDWDDARHRRRSWNAPKVFDDVEEQRNKWFEEFERDQDTQLEEQSQNDLVNEQNEKEKLVKEALEELKRVSVEIQEYKPFRRSVDAESEPLIDLTDSLEKRSRVDGAKLLTDKVETQEQPQSQWPSNKVEKTISSNKSNLQDQKQHNSKFLSMENATTGNMCNKSSQTEKQHNDPNKHNPLEESISFILQETERKCHETINMRNKRNYTETEKKDRAAKRAGGDWQDIFDKKGYFRNQTTYDDHEDDNNSSTSESSSSDSSSTSSNSSVNPVAQQVANPLDESLSVVLEQTKETWEESLLNNPQNDKVKLSVRERIAAFEQPKDAFDRPKTPKPILEIASKNTIAKLEILSRNSSVQKSESELEEDDSGVTSDLSKPVSETDTDPECFPELRKMNKYQRAATHSRLFKLLQDEAGKEENEGFGVNNASREGITEEGKYPKVVLRSKKKIIHNVSITRRSNPEVLKEAETLSERRERLSLPLKVSNSIDADNLSTSNSPCSPAIFSAISEKLINELIQSLLMKQGSSHLRDLPWEKLQAAARKVLEESLDVDSLENTSIESTPAMTPQDAKNQYQASYADYYETWNRSHSPGTPTDPDLEIIPSKTFRDLHNQSPYLGQSRFRPVRCPRVLNTRSLNRDLTRATENRESASADLFRSSRSSLTPDRAREFSRAASVSRLGKV